MKGSQVQRGLCRCAGVRSTAAFGASERRNSAREDGLYPGTCGGFSARRPHEAINSRGTLLWQDPGGEDRFVAMQEARLLNLETPP